MWKLPLGLAFAASVLEALSLRVPVSAVVAGTEIPLRLAATATAFVLFGLVALLASRLSALAHLRTGIPVRPLVTIAVAAAGGLGLLSVHHLITFIAQGDVSYHALRQLAVQQGHDPTYTLPWLSGAEAAAVYEELAFRGVLLAAVAILASRLGARRYAALGGAVLVSSVVFGVYHLGTPLNMVIHAVSGLGFGLLFCWRGLVPAVVAHASVNALVYAFANYLASWIF